MVGSRLAAVAASALLGLSATIVAATPASATPPGCWLAQGHYEQAGGYITGYRFWACENGEDRPLPVSVDRYLSPGVYQEVASGVGEATYYCGGWAYGVFRTTGTGDFGILCS